MNCRTRRAHRARARLRKEMIHPRLSVFRSNTQIYAQIIDDRKGRTIASASSFEIKAKGTSSKAGGKSDAAKEVGRLVAERAKKVGVISVVFDRGSYQYHGRVKSLAEGAREGGLKF